MNSPTRSPRRSAAAPTEAGLAWARREAMETLARLIAPMMPHLAEEMHARLHPGSGAAGRRAALAGGRSGAGGGRDRHHRGAGDGQAARHDRGAAGAPMSRRCWRRPRPSRTWRALLAGKRIVKRVHVPNRIVNFVVADEQRCRRQPATPLPVEPRWLLALGLARCCRAADSSRSTATASAASRRGAGRAGAVIASASFPDRAGPVAAPGAAGRGSSGRGSASRSRYDLARGIMAIGRGGHRASSPTPRPRASA